MKERKRPEMKNRTAIGIACIAASLLVCFAAAPLVNRLSDSRREIIRMKRDVARGHEVTGDDIEKVTVGAYGLPDGIITDREQAEGKYASADLAAGDWLLPSKLSGRPDGAEDVFRTLDGARAAVSVTLRSFAAGLSGKLENGDVVSLAVYSPSSGRASVPAALRYVRVIASTTAKGADSGRAGEGGARERPETLTLLVNMTQAGMLAEYEHGANIHAVLVYRGPYEGAARLLAAQEEYFEKTGAEGGGAQRAG